MQCGCTVVVLFAAMLSHPLYTMMFICDLAKRTANHLITQSEAALNGKGDYMRCDHQDGIHLGGRFRAYTFITSADIKDFFKHISLNELHIEGPIENTIHKDEK